MASKDLNQFYNEVMSDVANDPSLLEDINSSDDFEALFTKLSKLGIEKGYNFSNEELRDALDSRINIEEQELSDELLVAVAGGKGTREDDTNDTGVTTDGVVTEF